MTASLRAALVAVMLAAVAAAAGPDLMDGGPPGGPPTFLRRVFTPKMVMAHQLEIGLRPEQIDAIKRAMDDTQHESSTCSGSSTQRPTRSASSSSPIASTRRPCWPSSTR